MLNELMEGISQKLHGVFGAGYAIYRDEVQQGLETPCFFIAPLQPSRRALLGGRFSQKNPFDVGYFPKVQGDNGDLWETADRLFEALEYITLADGGQVRGTGLSAAEADGVLHVTVSYNLIYDRPGELPPMETLGVVTGTKKEGDG